ncbi:MAG: sec-independent protein translocase protein TatC [Candidatus Sumerlaeota bacterium]|nr:sec-independent protein translocase protein TatC [Candidatus Sumerlaeota bacterium]
MRIRQSLDDHSMSVLEHLDELRTRLIRSVAAIMIGTIVGYFLAPTAIGLLLIPIEQSGLVRKGVDVARIEVGEDGTFHLGRIGKPEPVSKKKKTDPEQPDEPSEPAPFVYPETQTKLASIEFYQPGAEEPFAVMRSVEPSGVVYIRPMDPFIIQIKAAVVLGILFALPIILYQGYAFVAPGMLPHERKAIIPLFWGALVLFPIGVVFAWAMLKFALLFFASYASEQAYLFNDIRAYLNLALMTMLSFGIVFEFPVVVLLLTRLGIVSVDTLAAKRKHIFVSLLVVAAFVTPTGDPFTLAAMSIPLYLLFELALLLGRRPIKREPDPE